jgi:beta-barrel assembly-enhancing protease
MTLFQRRGQAREARGPRIPIRLIIALVIAGGVLLRYYSSSSVNPVTGRTQHISMSHHDEMVLGMNSAPEMARQMGGVSPDTRLDQLVDRVGARLVAVLPADAPPYSYEFHVLEDDATVNAFALPGGQIFITEALLSRLETEGQLAGVLGHEIGHVVGRHGAEHMEKAKLTQGLVGAVGVAASDSPEGARAAQAVASMVGNMITMKYGRNDELESDALGLQFMHAAGYDPRALIRVMEILREASGGNASRPEFMSTHPDPGNRIERINEALREMFPDGVPSGLTP